MNILITLDYELFSGAPVGTPENCIIKPMLALNDVAERWGVKYVVFVDAAYLLQLERNIIFPPIKHDYDMLVENIRFLDKQGHDIQLHFHPQWMYSIFEDGEWRIDTTHFKLSDMDEEFAESSFIDAKKCIEKILGHQVYAFRAGGYCLDTYTSYLDLFKRAGISMDSSVARYKFVKSEIHEYDYRFIPNEQIYRFSKSVKEKDEEGKFLELSIASVKDSFFDKYLLIKKMSRAYQPKVIYKDGLVLSDGKKSRWRSILSHFRTNVRLCSIDGSASSLLEYYYDKCNKMGYSEMVMIGHPKNATDASINNLATFFSKHFGVDTFRTTKDYLK